MKKSYIIIVLVVVLGIVFFISKNSKVEAPKEVNENSKAEEMGDLNEVDNGAVQSTGEVKEFTIEGKNFSLTPSTLTVNKGDKVKITYKVSEGFHGFVIDEYGAAAKQSKAPAEEVLEFTANKAGSFEYYCSVGSHRSMGMVGTLIVK